MPDRKFQFGAFEVHERSGELRKHGVKIRVQEQPFQILVLLLERPNEIVSREEIRAKLWPLPDNTIVYPGHGPATTIGEERRTNPFLTST